MPLKFPHHNRNCNLTDFGSTVSEIPITLIMQFVGKHDVPISRHDLIHQLNSHLGLSFSIFLGISNLGSFTRGEDYPLPPLRACYYTLVPDTFYRSLGKV